MWRFVMTAGLLFALALFGSCCWLAGDWIGGHRERYARYVYERGLLEPVLSRDPAFGDVKVLEETGRGGVWLVGTVKSRTDRDRLRAELIRLFDESRADELLPKDGSMVIVKAGPAPKRP